MQIIKCDRCKREEQTVDVTSYKFIDGWWRGSKNVELCHNCNIRFNEVMNNFMRTQNE